MRHDHAPSQRAMDELVVQAGDGQEFKPFLLEPPDDFTVIPQHARPPSARMINQQADVARMSEATCGETLPRDTPRISLRAPSGPRLLQNMKSCYS